MATWTEEQMTLARAITARLDETQRARKLSDRELVSEYPDLGSTKTWRTRLLGGNLAGLNPDRTIERLQRVSVILDGGTPDAIFYRDLPFVSEIMARVGLLERTTSDRRILVCLAPNGVGKTTCARWAVQQARVRRAYCRLRPGWRNKELHICNGIARALGADDTHANAADAEQRLITLLSGQARTIFLDQAHEGGPALMHLLRALVDETPARFIYLGYDTAFRKVACATTDALIEAQAFMGRCQKPIFDLYKTGTQTRDVAAYLAHAGLPSNIAKSVAGRVTPVLQRTTNLRLLDDAILAARAASDADEADADTVVTQVYTLCGLAVPAAAPAGEKEEA